MTVLFVNTYLSDVSKFEAKSRVFKFDYGKMNTFEFVGCSKILYRVHALLEPALEYYPLLNRTLNKTQLLLSKNLAKNYVKIIVLAGSNHAGTVHCSSLFNE